MADKPKIADYEQPAYESKYQGQMDTALSNVTNRKQFEYDPLKDANYTAMAKVYQKQGEQAAKNTLGDAAALNGGYGSSYAVTASQQARNDYNQQLASQIPALQEAAYNRYLNNYNMDVTALSALKDADDSAYNKYRDKVSDSQWKYGSDYQNYRDDVSDSQWQKSYDRSVLESDRDYNYKKSRDQVADSQWAQEFALKKATASSSGGEYGSDGYLGSDGGIGFDALWDGDSNNGISSMQNAASKVSAAAKNMKPKSSSKKSSSKKTTGGARSILLSKQAAKKKK